MTGRQRMKPDRITNYDQIPLFLDVNELAKVLGIPKSTAYDVFRINGFPVSVIGGRKMVRKEKLLDWLAQQQNKPTINTTIKRSNRHE